MKRPIKAAIFAGALLFAGCPNDTTPPPSDPKCECPEGTTHKEGEKCCEGIDCACETKSPTPEPKPEPGPEPEPEPALECECTEGTVHITDDPELLCCDGEDCDCTYEQKTWDELVCGITVVNESNASIAANISKVDGAVASVNARLVDRIKGLTGAKIIVESGDNASFALDGNAVKISINSLNNQTQLSGILKNAFSEIAAALNEYYLDYDVKVVNETGGQFREGLIGDITTALNYFADPGYPNSEFLPISGISARYPEIIITDGTDGLTNEAFDGDTIKVGQQYLLKYAFVEGALEPMLYDMLQKPDPKVASLNKFKL